jgi:hypothetical protein
VDADRALALPSASLTPDQHINTELYRLVPNVDPESDEKAVRFYSAQNRETGQFDWTVPPGSLDDFVGNESERMNIAAYSRMMGGTTPSNIEVQRMLRDGSNGDVAGMASHFGRSWKEGLKDPLFYLNMAGGVATGSVAKATAPVSAVAIAEGASGKATVGLSDVRSLRNSGLSRTGRRAAYEGYDLGLGLSKTEGNPHLLQSFSNSTNSKVYNIWNGGNANLFETPWPGSYETLERNLRLAMDNARSLNVNLDGLVKSVDKLPGIVELGNRGIGFQEVVGNSLRGNVTNWEVSQVVTNPEYAKKATFYLNGKIVEVP